MATVTHECTPNLQNNPNKTKHNTTVCWFHCCIIPASNWKSAWIILHMRPDNESWRYTVTSSRILCVHTMITSSNGNIFRVTEPFVRGIHRSPVNSPHKGQWRGALVFSLICAWISDWVNTGESADLRRHHAHYHVTVMKQNDPCGLACLSVNRL